MGAGNVAGNAPGIPCQQWTAGDGSVRADQEVGKNSFPRPACSAISGVGVAGEKRGGNRDLLDHRHRGKRRAKRLDALEARSDLSQHDRVHDQRSALDRPHEVRLRPVQPLRIVGEDIEQNVLSTTVPPARLTGE